MRLYERLQILINEGITLVPIGGKRFSGYNNKFQPEYVAWRLKTISALEELGPPGRHLLKELEKDENGSYFYESSVSIVLGVLKAASVLARKPAKKSTSSPPLSGTQKHVTKTLTNQVFIVHGHDETLLQQIARFLERLDIIPIILFEKAGKGQTIMEKLESNSKVPFTIVLLTPDDIGKGAKDKGQLQPRARQNVILELGYFIGILGRSNTIVLYDESVELPSDYRGVEYIKIDAGGAWKLKLAREMKEAGLMVDMNKAI